MYRQKVKQMTKSAPVTERPSVKEPEKPDKISLDGGNDLLLFRCSGTELLKIDIVTRGGKIEQTRPLQAEFTALLLTGGTKSYSADTMAEMFDYYGTVPETGASLLTSSVSIMMMPEYLRDTGKLISEIIYHPVFPGNEIDMHIKNEKQRFMVSRERVAAISLDHFMESLFGPDHPWGKKVIPSHFDQVEREDLICFHRKYFRESPITVALSGKVRDETIAVIEELFGTNSGSSYKAGNTRKDAVPAYERPAPGKLFIGVKGARQDSINIGQRTIGPGNPDFIKLVIANTILGGYFGSRLMQSLREKSGYTYGIHSLLVPAGSESIVAIMTEADIKYRERVVKGIYDEIEKMQREPVGGEELEVARSYLLGSIAHRIDGPFNRSEAHLGSLFNGMGSDYYKRLISAIKAITPDEIKRVISSYYILDNMHEIVAGG